MERDQKSMVTLTDTDQVNVELILSKDASADAGKFTITDDKEAGAYELKVDDRVVAGLLYQETGTRVTLLASAVFPEFRGKGIAGELLSRVLVMLRSEGRTATLTCPFATAFLHSHPEYADVVDPIFPGNAHSSRHGRIR